jgi:hypothetical protein
MVLGVSCVEPFNIKNSTPANNLVIEGVLSNIYRKQQIFLSRTTTLTDKTLRKERGANIVITDDEGNVVSLTEASPGIYETPDFAAHAGGSYTLHIKTSDGREYASANVPFKDGSDLGAVYPKYEFNSDQGVKGIQLYLDAEDPNNNTRFYRWNYISTYEVHAPFPSDYIWLGGNNVAFRYHGIDTCFVTDTLQNVLIRSTQNLEKDKIEKQKLQFIPEYSHSLRYRYSLFVQQFCLSEESYLYWENLRTISEQQGTLSDVQPGSLPGNIVSLTDPRETVLGYFDVCRVSEKRIFFSAVDFYDEGMKLPDDLRSYCYDIAPILVPGTQLGEIIPEYERTMYIWEVYGFEPNETFELMPKYCCDCRDQGPNERPPFF